MKWAALVGAALLATLAGCGEGASTPASGTRNPASASDGPRAREAAPAQAPRTHSAALESGGGTSSLTGGGTDTGTGSDAGTSTGAQPAPSLVLDAPQQGAFLGTNTVTVVGHVADGTPPLRVTVGDQTVPVVAGAFSTSLTLEEGERTLDIRVTDAEGRTASAQRTVQVDVTPPSLEVTRPTGSQAVTESPYLVTGLAGDTHLAGVSVQGQPVPLVAGTFSVAVPLSAGANTVRIVATDLAGNPTVVERTLTLSSTAPQVTVLEPLPGTEAAQPVVHVRARVTSTAPLAEVRVGTGSATLSGPQEYSADVPLSLGDNSLTVYARDTDGLSSSATVQVRYRSAESEPLAVTGVDPLPGTADVETDSLISVSFNKPALYESLDGHFTVSADGVPLAGGYSLAPGGQTATFVAREPLPEGKRITVRVSGVRPALGPELGGGFTSDFTVRRPLTRVRGLVTDLERQPLGGVTVSLEGQGLSTSTGPDGNWVLFLPKGGEYTVRYEGGVRSTGERFPTVRRRLFITEGELTTDVPLVLTPTDVTSSESVDVTKPVNLTFSGRYPGLSLQVAANGLSFEDGHTADFVTATQLQPYALPVPLMGQAAPVGLWQLSPAGIRVQAPVTLTLPNLTGAPAGRLALVLGYDATRHVLERVAFAKVSADGFVITTDEPLKLSGLDFIGYMPLTDEQHAQVAAALGLPGGASGAGTDGGQGSGVDGGLGMRMPAGVKAPRSPWWDMLLYPFAPTDAHAYTLAELFNTGLSSFDGLTELVTPGSLSGYVRTPREREVQFTRTAPADADFERPQQVPLPYTLPIDFEVKLETANSMDALVPDTVRASVRAEFFGGAAVPTASGAPNQNVGLGQARLRTGFLLPLGKTRIWLAGSSLTDSRELELEAELSPGDGGSTGMLVLRKVADSTPPTDPALRASTRYRGYAVKVTGPANGGAGVTGNAGNFGVPIQVLPPFEQGVACTDIPLGPRLEEHTGPDGITRYSTVTHMLPVCSHSFSVYPGRNTQADIIVDARLLYGAVTFVDRQGEPIDAACEENAKSLRTESPGEYVAIAPEDVKTTEVHFFREDDLEHPIATFDVARPDPRACDNGVYQPGQAHGLYSRIRIGPASALKKYALERCAELSRKARTADEEEFFKANCKDNRTNFLSLSTGDRLVVFAINHTTGYAGMTTVTVPPISRSTVNGADGGSPAGGCKADEEAGGPLPVNEYDEKGNQLTISRCTAQELGIPADLKLYPPEIDIRVTRRAEDEGLKSARAPNLVRHGGAATTRDDFLSVNTHWRVRVKPVSTGGSAEDAGTPDAGTSDGGTSDAGQGNKGRCIWELLPDGGFRADGGNCGPGELVDYGDAGTPLEVMCSELPPNATTAMRANCFQWSPDLVDVPSGIAPLAGRVVGVTNSAVGVPAVVQFPVLPGRHTATVQASLRYQGKTGQVQTLSTLPKANYYVHVVGHPMLPRDKNGDGFIQKSEENTPVPDFSMPPGADAGYPPGLPEKAIGLKNVYRHVEAAELQRERYDRALEHEFRVLDLGPTQVTARTSNGSPDAGVEIRDLKETAEPTAKQEDLSYEFLSVLLAPTEPGRAGTLGGEYVVRLGGDKYGIECPFIINPDEHEGSIKASCGGEYLPYVLNANDILYIELYLSGNAENVLYRFNFFGLATRKDLLSAGSAYTARQSVKANTQGVPAPGRSISQPALANFFVEPGQFNKGVVRVCLNDSCAPKEKLLKEARLELDALSGFYKITPNDDGSVVKDPLAQSSEVGVRGARRFSLLLPPELSSMPGSSNPPVPIYVVYAPEAPTTERRVEVLGKPQGSFEGENADAKGQATVAGVNLADGHLSFSHTDFSVPYYAGSLAFIRTYNNQNNQPTPLGLGWTHNQEGWVAEESPDHRYTVVLGGQSYAFPECAPVQKSDQELNPEGVECTSDGAHGFKLRVNAPVPQRPFAPDVPPSITLFSPDGTTAVFNRIAMKGGDVGRRRWLLVAYQEGHGEALTCTPDGSGCEGNHWTHLRYDGNTDRIQTIERTPGLLRLKFEYADVNMDDPETPETIRALVRSQGFKWLSAVRLETTEGTVLYRSDFTHDKAGNLLTARRWPGKPFQIWKYTYEQNLAQLKGDDRWRSLNELRDVQLIHGDTQTADSPVQWRAKYLPASPKGMFTHVNVKEVIGSVTQTGQQGLPLTIAYPKELERTVTTPAGVSVSVFLNEYGNVVKLSTSQAETLAQWNSDELGKPITTKSSTDATGLEMGAKYNEAHLPLEVQVLNAPATAKAAAVDSTKPLAKYLYESPGKPGIATRGQLQSGSSMVNWSAPRTSPSGPESITVTDPTAGTDISLMSGAAYDKYGRLTSSVDAQQRKVTFTYDDTSAGLGQVKTLTLELPDAEAGALKKLTRNLTRDAYGRLQSTEDVETGAKETFTYDGLGRILSRTRSGTPAEAWTYAYAAQDDKLLTTEKLTLANADTGAEDHEHTTTLQDGLKISETFRIGKPARTVTRSFTYKKGRLASSTDELNHVRKYVYDADGQLTQVRIGEASQSGTGSTGDDDASSFGQAETTYELDAAGRITAITDHLGRRTTIDYDILGRPVAWDYGNDDKEEVLLDAQGAEVRRSFGRNLAHVLETTLDGMGHPSKVASVATSSGGVERVTQFDAAGRVSFVHDKVMGLYESYEYKDVLGRLTKAVRTLDKDGSELTSTETRTYTDVERKVVIDRVSATGVEGEPRQESETRYFDVAGRVVKVERQVDGVLATNEYTYNARGQVLTHTGPQPLAPADSGSQGSGGSPPQPARPVVTYSYDPLGNLVSVEDPEHFKRTYTLDDAGHLKTEEGPHPGYKVSHTYDLLGRPLKKTIAAYTLGATTTPEAVWTYEYLPGGKVVEHGPENITVTRVFNARDRLVKETRSGSKGDERIVDLLLDGPWEYQRKVTEGTWALSKTTEVDDRGRPRQETESWSGGGASYRYSTATQWDKQNQRSASVTSSWTMGASTRLESITRLELDSLGNLKVREKGGFTDTWLYGADGLLSVTRPSGRPETKYVYDNGLLKTETYADDPPTMYAYFPDGRLREQVEPTGRSRSFEYNPRGLVTAETYKGNTESQRTEYAYGPDGARSEVKYGAGVPADEQTWHYLRGARGELLGVEQPQGLGTFNYVYDALLRLKSVEPPAGGAPKQTFEYDHLDRMVLRTRGGPQERGWSTSYESGVAKLVTPTLDVVTTVVDGRGRPASVTYTAGPDSSAYMDLAAVSYAYDGTDQLLTVNEKRHDDTTSSVAFFYDSRSLLQRIERGGNDVVDYDYTPSGQRWHVRVGPVGAPRTVTYGYDAKDRISQVISSRGMMQVGWEPGGGGLQMLSDSTLVQRRCYDGVGRLRAIVNAAPGSSADCDNPPADALAYFQYTYDARGNRRTETAGGGGYPSSGLTMYGYDGADRLTGVRYPDGRVVLYSLAGDGTRLGEKEVEDYATTGSLGQDAYWSAVGARSWRSYQHDGRGGLLSITDENTRVPIATISTDASGRVRSEARAGGTTRFGWDAAGRLTNVSRGQAREDGSGVDGTAFQYTYDFAGLRRTQTVNGELKRSWLYVGRELLDERLLGAGGEGHSLLHERVAGLAVAAGDERILYDGLGSAVGHVGASRAPTLYRYDEWGGYIGGVGPGAEEVGLGYAGHVWDAGTSLVYAQERWYATALGRFLTEDPVGGAAYLEKPQGLNPWSYAKGNPLRYVDPDGRCPTGLGTGPECDEFDRQSLGDAKESVRRCWDGERDVCIGLGALTVGPYAAAGAVEVGIGGMVAAGRSGIAALYGATIGPVVAGSVGMIQDRGLGLWNSFLVNSGHWLQAASNLVSLTDDAGALAAESHAVGQLSESLLAKTENALAQWLFRDEKPLANAVVSAEAPLAGVANGAIARIEMKNAAGEIDSFLARDVGKSLSDSWWGPSAYRQMQKAGFDGVVDFGAPPTPDLLGVTNPFKYMFTVYARKAKTASKAAQVVVHESSHINSLMKGRPTNTVHDEYMAFRREYLFVHGVKPDLETRKKIWAYVYGLYGEHPLGRVPAAFQGVEQSFDELVEDILP